jgi:hypothetical protein
MRNQSLWVPGGVWSQGLNKKKKKKKKTTANVAAILSPTLPLAAAQNIAVQPARSPVSTLTPCFYRAKKTNPVVLR